MYKSVCSCVHLRACVSVRVRVIRSTCSSDKYTSIYPCVIYVPACTCSYLYVQVCVCLAEFTVCRMMHGVW